MQKVAQSWLVFDLTKSSFFLGLDDFLGQLPILLFTLVGGVVADRHDRRRLLLGSQYIQMATAFMLAALVYLRPRPHLARAGALVRDRAGAGLRRSGLSVADSVARAQEGSAERDRAQLDPVQPRARVRPAARRRGAAAFGTAACFGLNGLSFLVVIVALMSLHIKHIRPTDKKPMLQELKGGIAYARSQPAIIALTVLAFLTTFLGLPLLTFLPVFAREIFHGDVSRYTHMMAFSGAGRRRRRARRRVARTVQAHGAHAARRAGRLRRADRGVRAVAGAGGGAACCSSWPAPR